MFSINRRELIALAGATACPIAARGQQPVMPAIGSLDDVRIYNRALSATEVQQLYNAGR